MKSTPRAIINFGATIGGMFEPAQRFVAWVVDATVSGVIGIIIGWVVAWIVLRVDHLKIPGVARDG